MTSVPETNLIAYQRLYAAETALRELIVQVLEEKEGPHWFKRRLPEDVLGKYRDSIDFERASRWSQLIPHHPIYYTDFGDLRKIIERNDNWRDCFQSIFRRKDLVASLLSELELIRNKVAHNRKVSDKDVQIDEARETQLRSMIGEQRYVALSGRNTLASDIMGRIDRIRSEIDDTFRRFTQIETIQDLSFWQSLQKEWWFEESYLGQSLDALYQYFAIIEEYVSRPRTRGSGHSIEKWVRNTDITSRHRSAIEVVERLKVDWNRE